jgi:hypothetical protein
MNETRPPAASGRPTGERPDGDEGHSADAAASTSVQERGHGAISRSSVRWLPSQIGRSA